MSRQKLSLILVLIIIVTLILTGKNFEVQASVTDGSMGEQEVSPTPEIITPAPGEITPDPEQVTPTPGEVIPLPTLPVMPSVTPIPTIPVTPSVAPTKAPTPTLTPAPTKIPYRSKTLELMSTYDYVGRSVTGISQKKEPLSVLQNRIKAYGSLYGSGMPFEEYKKTMNYQWVDATEYDKKPTKISVSIKDTMDYKTYVNTLKSLSRYKGVYLYKIGKSTLGRDLYAIEINVDSSYKKNVIMMTGQVHGREFAGGTFIVKELVDLVQNAQTDKKTMELLKRNKYVAVPIINVDVREGLIYKASNWTTKGKELWKAYANGTDGGRNFPGLQWGQVAKGSVFKSSIATKPGYANYAGKYAGSNSETKAMMKWLYHYIIVEKADRYIDMHQQGSIVYAGKTWQTKTQEKRSQQLRTDVMNILNKGITTRKYSRVYEGGLYGMLGEGSSLTDYAITLAVGAKFSPAYGFHAFTDDTKEYILLQVKDLDQSKIKFKEANSKFAAITLEIGYGREYLGNSAATRRLLSQEYQYYNYAKLLETLPQTIK